MIEDLLYNGTWARSCRWVRPRERQLTAVGLL